MSTQVSGPQSTTSFRERPDLDVGSPPFEKTVVLLEQTEQIRQQFEQNINALTAQVDAVLATIDSTRDQLLQEEKDLNWELVQRRADIGAQVWSQTPEGILGIEKLNELYPSIEQIPPIATLANNVEQVPQKLARFFAAVAEPVVDANGVQTFQAKPFPVEDQPAQSETIIRLNKLNDSLTELRTTQDLKNDYTTLLATPLEDIDTDKFPSMPPDVVSILNIVTPQEITVLKTDLEVEAFELGYPVVVTLNDGTSYEAADWNSLQSQLSDIPDSAILEKALHFNRAQTLEDANASASSFLKNALSNVSGTGLEQRQQQKFMASSSIVYLYSFVLLNLNRSDKRIEQLKLNLARDYVDFLQFFSNAKEEARARLETSINQQKGVAVQAAAKDPRWQVVHDRIVQLKDQLDQLTDYRNRTPIVLNDVMENDYILKITSLQNQLNLLDEKFKDMAIGFSEEWPPLDTENFNQKIVQRMLNPDIKLSKAKKVPENAKMTVSSVGDEVILVGTDVPSPRDSSANLELGTCGGPVKDRDYQKFLGDYLFGKGSSYKGLLANWGVGTGKTRAAIIAIERFIQRWNDKVATLWAKNPRESPEEADLSNYIQIWAPSDAIIKDTWLPELKEYFKTRADFVETPGAQFLDRTNPQAPGLKFVTPANTLPIYSHLKNQLLLNDPTMKPISLSFADLSGRHRIVITLNYYSSEVAELYWMQAPFNYILSRMPWGPNNPAPASKAKVAQTLSWTNTAEWETQSTEADRQKFRDYSPFLVLDEMHKLWQTPTNPSATAKKEFRFIKTNILPFHSFSKVLGLTATPFDLLKPNFSEIAQIVAVIKYYPDEGLDYKTEFTDPATGNVIDIDQVVVRDASGKWVMTNAQPLEDNLKTYFSGFLSYVSLNFDTTVYPYFNANICKSQPMPRGGSNICVASNVSIKKATNEFDVIDAFKELRPDLVYGQPTQQAAIRKDRQWKYTVPNLVQVVIDDPAQVQYYNGLFSALKDAPANAPFRKARLYDQTTFNDEQFVMSGSKPKVDRPEEEPLVDLPPVLSTITKGFLAPGNTARAIWDPVALAYRGTPLDALGLEEQAFLDVVGVIGPKITFTKPTVANEPWNKNIEVVTNLKQDFLVGSRFAAYEKGLTCAALLTALKDAPGKVIFIQTSYSGEDIEIQYFWDHYAWPYGPATVPLASDIDYKNNTFFEGIKAGGNIEIFNYVPYVAGTPPQAAPTPANWNIGPEAYWYQTVNNSSIEKGVVVNQLKLFNLKKITTDAEIRRRFIDDSIQLWYTQNVNNKASRIIYLGNRLYGGDTYPVVDIVKDFWRGLLNHRLNWRGDYFKGVCLTPTSTEGVSIFDVRYHVNLNPPQRLSIKEQAEGRGFRQCSLSNISWHHTQVEAEPDPSNPTDYRIATEYRISGQPQTDNGIFPEIYVMTLISTFQGSPVTSLIARTPDEIAADWIYKDPDAMGDAFLRFLQSLAVDNGLFGSYSGLKTLGGTLALDEDWNLATELVYQAVNNLYQAYQKSLAFFTSDPTDLNALKGLADYVKKFYRTIPYNIYSSPTSPLTPWEIFQNRALGLVQTAINEYNAPITGKPADKTTLNDLYAKLIWFLMENSNHVDIKNAPAPASGSPSSPAAPTSGFQKVVQVAQDALSYLNLRKAPSPSEAKKSYATSQFKRWLEEMTATRINVEKTKGINITKTNGLEEQANSIIQMSGITANKEESLLHGSLLAQYTRDKDVLPPPGYYDRYVQNLVTKASSGASTPIILPFSDWLEKAVRGNINEPGSYLTDYPTS